MKNPLTRAWAWCYDRPLLLATITMVCWAGNYVAARGAYQDVPPVTLAVLRWTGAFLVLAPFAWPHLKRDLPVILANWRIMLILSILGISGFNTLAYTALQYTTAVNAMLLQSSLPIAIAIFVFVISREWPTRYQALGVAVSLAGVAYTVAQGDLSALLSLSLNRGDLWMLAAVLTWGTYTALLRKRPELHWLSFLASTILIGILVLLPFLGAELASGREVTFSLRAISAVVYVALLPSVIAYSCYNRAVELAGGNRVAPLFHLIPIIGSIQAMVLLGEQLRLYHFIGFALVMSGIALTNRKQKSSA